MQNEPTTLLEAVAYFSDPDRAFDFMTRLRWPNGVSCPRCGSASVGFVATRRIWNCKGCKQQFSAKIGTVFEDSPIGFEKWLPAVWLIANAKNGISSYELGRSLGVTQKTAWFMLHRIRLMMQAGGLSDMGGRVEADETFIGGLARNMHKSKRERLVKGRGGIGSGKAVVMGLLERHGPDGSQVRVKHVADTARGTLQTEVWANVARDSEVITDAHSGYAGLDALYQHQVIDHAEAYARGHVHVNGLENFWSLLKRALKGTYVSVEPFHLFRYLDEQAFRFNARKVTDAERFKGVLGRSAGKRLTYGDLTGQTQARPQPAG